MSTVHSHPAMNEMAEENDTVISIYNGVRIPTGRKRRKARHGFGDLDPINTKLGKLIAGELNVKELDNEELTYGVPRCDDGKFSAKAAWQAAQLPRSVRQAIHRELYRRADDKLHGGLLGSLDTIVELATQPYAEDAVRFQAAKYILERLQGRTPEVHVHSQEAPWEVVLSGVERGPRPVRSQRVSIEDGNTEEADIVEDEE